MAQLCSNAALFSTFRASVLALQQSNQKHTRAHQVLPRYRRRRAMSYNFHRLPQFLRPRALKETGSSALIYTKNAPKPSRKHKRLSAVSRTHRFLAKRMKYFAGVPYRNTYKVLRRAQQQCIIPRTDGYVLYELTCEELDRLMISKGNSCRGIELIGDFPVEYFVFSNFAMILVYAEFSVQFTHFCAYQNIKPRESPLRSIVLYGDVNAALGDCAKDIANPNANLFAGTEEIVVIYKIIDPALIHVRHAELQYFPPLIQEYIAQIKAQPFASALEQKYIRCMPRKRLYCQLRQIQPNNMQVVPPFDFLLVREAYFSFIFVAEPTAHKLLRKLVLAGIPLAGALERRFLYFESKYVDVAAFRKIANENGRYMSAKIASDAIKRRYHHLHPKTALKDREELFIKWLLTDLDEWADVKRRFLQARAEKIPQPASSPSQPTYQQILAYGFEKVYKATQYVDKCYCLREGCEIGLRAGVPMCGAII